MLLLDSVITRNRDPVPETDIDVSYQGLLRNKAVLSISLASLVRILGRSQVWIFIPVYLSEIRNVNFLYIGSLFFITALLSLPFSIYGGNLIDRIGRRKVIIVLPAIMAILFTMMGISIVNHSSALIIYILFVLVEPIASLQNIVDNVVVSDSTSDPQRNNAFGLVRIAGNLGFSIGPAAGGFLVALGYQYIFYFPAVLSVAEIFLFLKYIRDINETLEPERKAFDFPHRDTTFITLTVLLSLIWFVAGQWGTTLTLFWSNIYLLPKWQIGVLYSVNGLVVVVLQAPINSLFRSIKDYTRLATGGLLFAVSFLAMAFTKSFYLIVVDVVFLTLAENIVAPVTMSMIAKLAPRQKRGQYFGAFQVVAGFIAPTAPVFGTYMLSQFAYSPLYFWSTVAIPGIIISLTVFYYGRRLYRNGRFISGDQDVS